VRRAWATCWIATAAALAPSRAAAPAERFDRKAVEALAAKWWKARPKTKFVDWDARTRKDLLAEARALGPIPEGAREEVRDVLWKSLERKENLPGGEGRIATPYGEASWIAKGRGGAKTGLVLGLHGGGEGAGDAGEAAGKWVVPGCAAFYPQGIRLVHDTWNTVHGERFCLTLLETAKARLGVDPDRVYAMGFSMGGTGSWFLAGRHADLLAAASPCAGVLMAEPKSQVATKEEVKAIQHGFVPNVRNLAMNYFIGLEDRNCMPGTYLFAWDLLESLRAKDPGGYAQVSFATFPGLAHAFPPGQPGKVLDWIAKQRRDPYPKKVVWEQATDPYPLPEDDVDRSVGRLPKRDFYWLRCDRPRDRALVVATLSGTDVEVSTTGVAPEDLTVFLNERMIDPSKEVVVRANGKEVYRGSPVPDLVTVLDTLDARLDRTLTFDRRVALGER
jgi:hypothetical protein